MIDVVYTGDIRHNQKIRSKNHKMFLDRLKDKIIHEFYNGKARKISAF